MRKNPFPGRKIIYGSIELKFTILLILIGLINLMPGPLYAMGAKKKPESKDLYLYNGNEIDSFLNELGYPGFTSDIWKNLDGTALIFFKWEKKKAVVVMCDGTVREIDLPEISYQCSEAVLFNSDYQAVAWQLNDGLKIKDGISNEEAFRSVSGINPSGGYILRPLYPSIVKNIDIPAGTSIHSVEDPDKPLKELLGFNGKRIFLRDNSIFVFGNGSNSDKQIELYILKRENEKIGIIKNLIIPRPSRSPTPFYVGDVNLSGDEILFVDVFDMPDRSEWYVYNLGTREMKKISKMPFSGGWGFYLQCDIIKDVTNILKLKK